MNRMPFAGWFPILCFALSLAANPAIAQQGDDNLNRIIRVKPSPTAKKIGTAVQWETDWDSACAKSRESGKPIFWYVPTIPGTFMDRKTEIDRYMLAGPFSWPPIIRILNDNYVPFRKVPTKAQAGEFDLKPYTFVEPGLLILDPQLKVTMRVDHLTTLHPIWLTRLIAPNLQQLEASPNPSLLESAWREFRRGNLDYAFPKVEMDDPERAEWYLLQGMFQFRSGDHDRAKQTWHKAAKSDPNSPLAWKAAAEAEGFGPFVRGMEVFDDLPEAAFQAGINSIGSTAPQGVYDQQAVWNRGVRFLLGMQNSNGGFFDSDYDFGGFDSLPNVHAAVTAICGMAMLAARDRVEPAIRARLDGAIERAAKFVADAKNHNPSDRDEILWSYAYRVKFLSDLIAAEFGDVQARRVDLNTAVKSLESIQLQNGRWYHEYTNPFVTGTALTALFAARQVEAMVDTDKVESGLKTLIRDRFENGAYPYYAREGNGRSESASLEASAGRLAICELALWYWDRIDDAQLLKAAQTSLEHHRFLQTAYKYDNHTSTMAYGGFFFWYDMQARAEMISRVGDADVREELSNQHRALIVKLPEIDGCFVDSHELGRSYGTAMALLSLDQLDAEDVSVKSKE